MPSEEVEALLLVRLARERYERIARVADRLAKGALVKLIVRNYHRFAAFVRRGHFLYPERAADHIVYVCLAHTAHHAVYLEYSFYHFLFSFIAFG